MRLLIKKSHFWLLFCFTLAIPNGHGANKINSIEISGEAEISEETIIIAGNLKVGDDVSPRKIKAIKKSIIELYKYRGFFKTKIKTSFSRSGIFRLEIKEGKPVIIKKINLSTMLLIKDKSLRKKLNKQALDAIDIKAGDRLDRKEIKTAINKLKEWLLEKDFLITKEPVTEISIKNNEESAMMNIKVTYGPRIRFGFRNNKRFSKKELLGYVSEVKEVGFDKDYLDAARERIIRAYNQVGLVNLKIKTVTRQDGKRGIQHVSFIVKEGKRIRITSFSLEGIYTIPIKEASDLFISFCPNLVQKLYFQDEGIRKAGDLLAEHLKSLGHLSAKLDLVKYKFSKEKERVDVILFFTEGVQTTVSSIELDGVTAIPKEEVKNILGIKKNMPFNVFRFGSGVEELKEKYKNIGYLEVIIDEKKKSSITRYSKDQSQVNIKLTVKEGPLIHAGEIKIRGNTKTRSIVITRELPFSTGDILTKEKLSEGEDRLRRLGLFRSTVFRLAEPSNKPNVRNILVFLDESIPGTFEMGYGYRTDVGLRFFAGSSYNNLGGMHRTVNLNASLNRRLVDFDFLEYNVNAGFKEPYFLSQRIGLFTNVIFFKRRFTNFDASISKGSVELRRDLTKKISTSLKYSFEQVHSFNAKDEEYNEEDTIGSLTAGIALDSRNNPFNPSTGFLSINQMELATEFLGSQKSVGYHRFTSNNSAYIDLGHSFVFSFGMNIGFERSNVLDRPVPKIKLFRLGGTSTLRGYKYDSLEVETQRNINGTLHLINYRWELQFPLREALGLGIFWDAGNLSVDVLRLLDLRHSLGVGVRYETPVGSVNLDLAYKLGQISDRGDGVSSTDPDRYRVHFSIGRF